WKYESEVRFYYLLADCACDREQEKEKYFVDFDSNLILREVIVGYRSTLSEEQQILLDEFKNIKLLFIYSILIILAVYFVNTFFMDEFHLTFDVKKSFQELAQENIRSGKGYLPGRFFDMILVYNHASSDIVTGMMGAGVGSTKLARIRESLLGETIMIGTKSQIATSIYETGYVGFILYLWIIFRAYSFVKRRLNECESPFWYGVIYATLGSIFLHVVATTYHGNWYSVYSSFPFSRKTIESSSGRKHSPRRTHRR
ncbi:MAG: hypothetical protein IIB77_09380, partial [Proteobacteria bacterium]|nr:hypothetical protein [Pseudomonadota bacterium]